MKKLKVTVTLALIFVVFTLLYFPNTALAEKAGFCMCPSFQTVDVSSGGTAFFFICDLDGSSSVRIEVQVSGSYVTVSGLSSITTTGVYTRTALQMQNQFGNLTNANWRVTDNGGFNHSSSTSLITIQD